MAYTDEQIKQYIEIINKFKQETPEDESLRYKCWNCQNEEFYVESGFYFC